MGICVEDSVTNHGAVIFHVELTCLLIGRKELMSSILCMFVIIIIIMIAIIFLGVFSPALLLMGIAVSNIML